MHCFKDDCKNRFQCKNYECIDKAKVCDGIIDCSDSSDELNLQCFTRNEENTCSHRSNMFKCSNGGCVDASNVCNKIDNCGDNSDEIFCNYDYKSSVCELNKCSKMMINSTCVELNKYGYKCNCQNGFKINSKNECVDINECDQLVCGQICTNTYGSYICSCDIGYQLDIDKHSCFVRQNDENRPYILYGDSYFIKRLELNGTERILTKELRNIVALDFDFIEQKIYFSDITTNYGVNICRINFDGKNKEVLHSLNLYNPDGIAVDWIGRNIYWCDKEKNTIEASKLNGLFPKTIIKTKLDDPRAIVLFPKKQ